MSFENTTVLVVDDEPDLRTLYELTLLREGYRVYTAGSVLEARAQLQQRRFEILITDMRLPDGLGMELLQDLRSQGRSERAIVMTAYGSADNAVAALREGAFDYLTKPVDLKQFRQVVASASQGLQPAPLQAASPAAFQPTALPGKPSQPGPPAQRELIGPSLVMQQVRERIAKVAGSMAPILVRGESGTGKELVAQSLHRNSQRATGPMVAVNCGAIPENLLEAEFFGARKGAYTGANQDREGFFQAAHGGTLFLDEIGELPLSMQAKLLRAIQERKVRPLGAQQEEVVDVRIVSATHRDLGADVQTGRFRQDLYYRLNVIDIFIPPLRERREDLPALCQVLLERIAHESGQPVPQLSTEALHALAGHALPGNVRELENLLLRSVALSDSGLLHIEPARADTASPMPAPAQAMVAERAPAYVLPTAPLLPPEPQATAAVPSSLQRFPPPQDLPSDLQAWLDAIERDILVRALQEFGFNRTAAANRLGISLRQIRYRMERLQIHDPSDGVQP
ncbi:sigma-54-dependent Fis family transcriptional regulator [Comamonas piscis]|uniref:Sigma-54-dependent Fis family transcriptional regulator n=1 Tax=Comamonas piscis TaxID=1562974 RepID=A0A7G5EEW1_9BURK|nr:sigma-54 dependent transcriptional regulator [Comamonas piscis]QMV72536.1 sigma-54-dependent Fis family transcriptional regulator [Comamonas piscis]WSO35306.1 sigma-54 dependent transcriptional regulator [Comamonas piscis]